MNPDKQRTEIAKACGWKFKGNADFDTYTSGWHGSETFAAPPGFDLTFIPNRGQKYRVLEGKRVPVDHLVSRHNVPDYLNDLNAMHKAIDCQSEEFKKGFHFVCEDLIEERNLFWFELTATDLSILFLKTLNLWEDEEIM